MDPNRDRWIPWMRDSVVRLMKPTGNGERFLRESVNCSNRDARTPTPTSTRSSPASTIEGSPNRKVVHSGMFRSTTTILLACIICCASAAEDSQSESTPEQPPIGIVSEDEVPDYLAPQNEHPEGAKTRQPRMNSTICFSTGSNRDSSTCPTSRPRTVPSAEVVSPITSPSRP